MKRKPRRMARLFAFLRFLRYVQELPEDSIVLEILPYEITGADWKALWVAPEHCEWMPRVHSRNVQAHIDRMWYSPGDAKRRYCK